MNQAGRAADPLAARLCAEVFLRLNSWLDENRKTSYRLLVDRTERAPYNQFQETKGPLNQIRIRSPLGGELVDLGSRSPVVRAIETLEVWRAYFREDDIEMKQIIEQTIKGVVHATQQ